MRKILLAIGIVLFTSLQAMAIKQPHIITPDPNDVSLRPLITWAPVEDAASYSLKVKEVASTGETVTIETATITAPTTDYRLTTTLTAGSYYKIILQAIDSDSTDSDKEKLYFQAKDKVLTIGQTEFGNNGFGTFDDYERIGFFVLDSATIAETATFITGASFSLPGGSIITGFSIILVDNTASETTLFLVKSTSSVSFEIIGEGSNTTITTSGTDASARTFSLDYDLTDPTTLAEATVEKAFYQIDLNLALSHELRGVVIRYI